MYSLQLFDEAALAKGEDNQQLPLITAHAGANNTVPNTISSIEALLLTSCDVIEVDVRNYENQLILSHNAPASPENLTTLKQCFALVARYASKQINCDLKQSGLVRSIIQLAMEYGMLHRLVFTGYASYEDQQALFKEKSLHQLWLRYEEECPKWGKGNTINCDYHVLTPEEIARLHAKGCAISAWTIDEETDLTRFLGKNIQNITTNNVTAALALRQAQREKGCEAFHDSLSL